MSTINFYTFLFSFWLFELAKKIVDISRGILDDISNGNFGWFLGLGWKDFLFFAGWIDFKRKL